MKNILSKSLRIIALLVIIVFSGYVTWLVSALGGDLLAALIFFLPGPILITIGITLSFLNDQKPALLRIETMLGFLLTAYGGAIGMFSVGGILILSSVITVLFLLVDWLFWKNTHRDIEYKTKNRLLNILTIMLQILFSLVVLFLVVITVRGLLIGQQAKQDSRSTGILPTRTTRNLQHSIQKEDGSDFQGSYTEGLETSGGVSIGYIELDKHKDVLRFRLNKKTYLIKPRSRTVFYGALEPDESAARRIILIQKDGSKINGNVANREFVLQSTKAKAYKSLAEVRLINDKNHIFLKEKIEHDEEFEREIREMDEE